MSRGGSELEHTVDRLFTAGHPLSPALANKLLAFGPVLEEPLLALIADDALFEADARGRGLAPVHALRLLGRMQATRAIPRMIEILAASDDATYAHGAAYHGLIDMGAAALEPCLAAHSSSDDEEARSSLVHVMAHLGTRDDRVYQLIVADLDDDPGLTGALLGEHGDPRGLPLIARVLDDLVAGTEAVIEDFADSQDVLELVAAIEHLGGTPHPAHLHLRDRVLADRRVRYGLDGVKRSPVRASDSPGRNDPCPCGSGRKYKKYHLPEDEAGEPD
jgi:hypothetical protein